MKDYSILNQEIEGPRIEGRIKFLEDQIRKYRKKNFKENAIKNFKICGSALNLALPFVVIAGVTVGTFQLIGMGLPFKKDKFKSYKQYSLEYETGKEVELMEKYSRGSLPVNTLKVISAWEKQEDESYKRTIRGYDIEKDQIMELMDDVVNEDVSAIEEKAKDYSEEIEQISNINIPSSEYKIKASLHTSDKNDYQEQEEGNPQNLFVSFAVLLAVFGGGGLITSARNFDFGSSVRRIKRYHSLVDIKPIKEEKAELEKKVLSLKLKGRGNSSHE